MNAKSKDVTPSGKDRTPKPIRIRRGAVEVTIYRTQREVAGKVYDRSTLVYQEFSGKRVRQNFADVEEAKRAAELIANRLANGQTDVLALTNGDVAELQKARGMLAPFKLSVSSAVADYLTACGRLPGGASLLEAVDYFAKRHPANAPKKSVAEVAEEIIEDRRAGGCSAHHLRDMGIRLGRFGKDFAMPIASVEPALIRAYIQGLINARTGKPARNRSKENLLRMVKTLFGFARKQRYLSRELEEEILDLDSPKSEPSRIGIFNPDEMGRMLSAADSEIIPALAIAAFTGLRLAEVSRLDWRDVRLAEGCIIVEAAKAKTAARRIAPIPENLAAWIAPYARPEGVLNPAPDDNALGNRFERMARRAKVPWQRNGLRHSFISYRVALTKNVNQTALEAGNSAAIVFRNYREVVREEDAKRWFGIMPKGEANIVAMPAAVAA